MPDKIRSMLVEPGASQSLKAKYEEIYHSSETWLYTKSQGVHTTVLNLIRDDLPGRRVLDIGCGAGRLALMCAHFANEVEGIDFSRTAIEIARLNCVCTRANNVSFRVAEIDSFTPTRAFDVLTMVGVLEHVPDPLATLRRIYDWLKPGGLLVISCPNFLNFRGYIYMSLLTLFGLPMSLADLRQVYYWNMRDWAAQTRFRLERSAGAIYRFGWDEKGAHDMIKRVPLAAGDKGLALGMLDLEQFNKWILEQIQATRLYLDALIERGILKRIERAVTLELQPVVKVPTELWELMQRYINEDLESDPYWCDQEPFCYYGGEGIYLLRKESP